jgi:hypothetical protein
VAAEFVLSLKNPSPFSESMSELDTAGSAPERTDCDCQAPGDPRVGYRAIADVVCRG